eukprot:CAMPEP_0117674136 /NCGR_PEP_ID=MMETSP0804-20121206/14867_1 /TAXON_ID=1074897 /ORGANISM="Tetraselmis astigmatica, Strain CCMP880" /LENGTH=365 /DNA_ID=CAMNT_0005482965 /DNA_START=424 /DNA_END=1518 /DNA_ORIENTATION=+
MQALAKVSSVKVDTVQQEDDRFDPLSLASPGSASDVVPVSTGFPVSPKWYSEDKQKSMMSAPAYNHALDAPTLHGDSAALRRAVTELLFFASVGDLTRCRRIVTLWNLKVDDPTQCCDYDKRTPMHLAACEGACAVTEWLIESGADINAIDRFNRTPLDEAVRSNRPEIVQLLAKANAKVFEKGKLVPLTKSELADHGTRMLIPDPEYDTWEIDPDDLCLHEKLGEGEFGIVHRASFHGTDVAVKILKTSTDIAIGDFRTEISTLRQVHHPNAVQFLGACTKHQPYMLVTELMYGASLADAYRLENFQLSLRRSIELALDAARGMNYLHLRSPNPIIHRDLKVRSSPSCPPPSSPPMACPSPGPW